MKDAKTRHAGEIGQQPVGIYEGDMGFEVHVDDGLFTLVDAELETQWGPLSFVEACGLHDALTAAMGAVNGGCSVSSEVQ
jgi:hypothetical protein